jgi:hypothetical protein
MHTTAAAHSVNVCNDGQPNSNPDGSNVRNIVHVVLISLLHLEPGALSHGSNAPPHVGQTFDAVE